MQPPDDDGWNIDVAELISLASTLGRDNCHVGVLDDCDVFPREAIIAIASLLFTVIRTQFHRHGLPQQPRGSSWSFYQLGFRLLLSV